MNRVTFISRDVLDGGCRCFAWAFPALLAGFGFSLIFAGCGQSDGLAEQYPSRIEQLAVERSKRDPVIASQMRGRTVFEHYCGRCHGVTGEGDGFNSSMLKVPPRNLTDPTFQKKTTTQHLLRTIRKGGPAVGKSLLMPAWGHTLSKKQIDDVTAFLRTLKPPPKEDEEEPAEESTDDSE